MTQTAKPQETEKGWIIVDEAGNRMSSRWHPTYNGAAWILFESETSAQTWIDENPETIVAWQTWLAE